MERMNLLVCDLDGTLLGDGDSLLRFAAWYEGARGEFRLAYASGRFVPSILDSIVETALPEPDAVIGGVGSEIYDVVRGRKLGLWPPLALEWNPYVIRALGQSYRQLKLQPSEYVGYRKVSFYAPELDELFLDKLAIEMASLGQKVEIIYSSNRDLDILPAGVSKGAAAAYLARRWKLPKDRVIVAGDSGNDASLMKAGFRGIVVGNAQGELREVQAPRVYFASASYAAGVLEGLDYWLEKSAPGARRAPGSLDRCANPSKRG